MTRQTAMFAGMVTQRRAFTAPKVATGFILAVTLLFAMMAAPQRADAAVYQRVGWQTIMYLNKGETWWLAKTTRALPFPMSIAVWPARNAVRTGQCVALWQPLGPAFVYNQPFGCY